ncbi:sigma-54 interaction domain-containing protein [Variovorax arabinosiphilus]|uniref:sigma-54 interaction domain-containing protein n=1 Tax=Variovorax arabinosiphilus TaxID=3053498 RepID=UPI002576DF7D|nr:MULTISPECIES: sigma 54-interacting transcriptional regulator [unclassified Variovorax]MDM0118806.1 sigma 54-interacting transcriptional regulator [Variovorax sp. J2L1-78]MDM0129231.1 sigma 54-interacting transcriptional regulator [Variovorax sp. J2L1-63]MDM0232982.1 sigma 54-interacting transcriptional regulator [Variovorax sp. J2R1-6]
MGSISAASPAPPALPLDAQGILALAARSMFHLFSSISQGMFLVDRSGRIVWVNEGYKRFLPALGFASVDDFVGRPVEEVIHNTQMREVLESGKPILIDLLTNKAGTFVVSRIPLHAEVAGAEGDPELGEVIGAIGIVLFDHPETTLQPLISKFAMLQRDLDDARRELATQRNHPLWKLAGADGQRRAKHTFASFIGSSPAAVDVKRHARRAAQSSSPVLLLGETGTGKELLAHAIHAASARANGPFVSLNIAAVPDTLLEAEFFGFAPGAFTGADRKGREGKFKLADGGTLFLDEIGDMPLALQAKLLRALQEGEIEPLGSNKVVPFDARVIAATSRDLPALVREGRFREDLYYRLNVLPLRVPPLRERRSDIPALIEALGEDMAQRSGEAPPELMPDALALLAAQHWRGNTRELRNVLEQLAMRSDSTRIDAAEVKRVLAETGLEQIAAPEPLPSGGDADQAHLLRPMAEQIAELERRAIAAALARTGGNKLATARLLGISRATLYDRMGPTGD